MGLRYILLIVWIMPLAAIAGLLYHDLVVPAPAPQETNRAMRTRMCREHVDLARTEPKNALARTAVDECVAAGYITSAEGISAIE